jgi:predicted GTPase
MPYGAAFVAATGAGATIVDPRPWTVPDFAPVYAKYPHLGPVLPAMGYSDSQVAALRTTLNRADADLVITGTPIDLSRVMKLDKPVRRARYDFAELERPGLWDLVERFFEVKEKPV